MRLARAQFHAAKAQFAAGKSRCKNAKCQKQFAPVDHELQRAFSCRRERRKVPLRQISVGVVDNVDHESVCWVRRDMRHGEIESRFVVSGRVPQIGAKDEVAIGGLEIEDQGFAIAELRRGCSERRPRPAALHRLFQAGDQDPGRSSRSPAPPR